MRVSILIPCHNAERSVGRAVESALAQSHGDKEVIVIDDGSTDASHRVLSEFGELIRLERQEKSGGGATRNRLLELSSGDWLQYLDSDDYLLPDKIAAQVEFLSARPDVDVVYGPVVLESATGGRRVLEIPEPRDQPRDPWVLLARWLLPQTGSPLWRRAALEAVGGWKDDQPMCQEHELYLRLLVAGRVFAYCDVAGAVYRVQDDGSVSTSDPGETRRHRLAITSDLERFLADRDRLTPERRAAIQQSRFEIARIEWHHDRDRARALVAEAEAGAPGFVPSGDAFPAIYRALYRLFGFGCAETVADWRRALRPAGRRP